MAASVLRCLSFAVSLVAASALLGPGCACDDPAAPEGERDAGKGGHEQDAGQAAVDGGDVDAGDVDDGIDAGPSDAGLRDAGGAAPGDVDGGLPDAGDGFSWEDLWGDAGLPDALACLPGTAPDLSGGLSGLLGALDLHTYTGSREDGVVCGDQTCGLGVPCCVLCGYATCAEPGVDGGPPACPAFTQAFTCDGPEDCDDPAADTCCYSLSGTGCRAASECEITISLPDAGLPLPIPIEADGGPSLGWGDAGSVAPQGDASVLDASLPADAASLPDASEASEGPDAGLVDAGLLDAGLLDAGPTDAGGGIGDIIGEVLDQGVPVCRSFFDCDLLEGELCCTSERFVNVDLGLCMPALVCIGGQLP